MQKWLVGLAVMIGCGDGQSDPAAPCHATRPACTSSHDEDGDGIADDCDLCPTIAGAMADVDADGDGVGDACDPRPGQCDQTHLYTFVDATGIAGATNVTQGDDAMAVAATDNLQAQFETSEAFAHPVGIELRFHGFDGTSSVIGVSIGTSTCRYANRSCSVLTGGPCLLPSAASVVLANQFPAQAARALVVAVGAGGLSCSIRSDAEVVASPPAPSLSLPDGALTVSVGRGFGGNTTPVAISSAIVYTAAD